MSKRRNNHQQEEIAQQEALQKELEKRNGHYIVIKNAVEKAKKLLSTPEQTAVQEEIQLQLESIRNTLERKRLILESLNERIENLLRSNELEKEIVERSEMEENIEETIFRIRKITDRRNVDVEPSTSHKTAKVKLPKLSLTRFDGNPTHWATFWDSFHSTIDSNAELANIDKLKYLQNSLIGEAAQTIAGLQITNENYKEAIDLLEKRFGNKQIILSRHIETIMELPKINSNEDLHGIRLLYDNLESTTRSLKSIGVDSDSYSTVLSPIIMSKLPQELRLLISRSLEDEWNIAELLEKLGEEISLREKCTLASIGNVSHRFNKDTRGGKSVQAIRRPQPTFSTLVAENTQQQVPNCLFCQNKHYSASCTRVTDPHSRKKILRELRRCFVCLKGGHVSRDCTSRSRCFYCKERHHSSICISRPESRAAGNIRQYNDMESHRQLTTPTARPTPPAVQAEAQTRPVSTNLYISHGESSQATLLQTAKAQVHQISNPSNSVNVRVILDSCSQKSYVTTRLRDRLNLPAVNSNKVLIKEFGNERGTLQTCDTVQVAIRCADNLTVYINAFVVPLICSPLSNQAINFAKDMYPHLRNLPLADCGDGIADLEIDVMIGADFVHCFLLDQVVRGEQPLSPVAILTRFGYVLSGPVQVPSRNTCSSNITVSHVLKTDAMIFQRDNELNEQLKEFWNCESLGIQNDNVSFEIENVMEGKINFKENRYEVSLPVKEEIVSIPDNYSIAKKRLMSLVNRLKSKPDLFEQYNCVIEDQIDAGIVERVADDNEFSLDNIHYIPHSAVLKEDRETTKLRVVYDASCKVAGEVSLNQCLEPGPNLLPLIFDVLLRFRMKKIVLIGDLEKAFHQISIEPSQRDLLRFFWVDDSDPNKMEIIKLRFARLAFGLTCSPFILNSTIRYHLSHYKDAEPEFVNNVLNSLYVDDYASSFDSENEAFQVYEKLRDVFKDGGFNMRKWASNSAVLEERIEQAENGNVACSQTSLPRKSHKKEGTKVLGVMWNQTSDKLTFDLSCINGTDAEEPVTKRIILSSIARFYDPLGLLSPVTVPFKRLFQEICKLKANWDAQLSKEIRDRWHELKIDISKEPSLEINRLVLTDITQENIKSLSLHGFADASQIAYGGVVYLRIETELSTFTKLLASKGGFRRRALLALYSTRINCNLDRPKRD